MTIWRNASAVLGKVAQRQSIYALPININYVRDAINELAGGADIRFLFVDIDAGKVRGYFKKGYITRGVYASDSQLIGNIYVSANQSEEWQNFVAVKEMMHLLDSATSINKDREGIQNLIEDMAPDIDFLSLDVDATRGARVFADHVAIISAIEVLFPHEVRKYHRAKYDDDKIASYELAQAAAIPERFVRVAMKDTYFDRAERTRAAHQIQDIPPPK